MPSSVKTSKSINGINSEKLWNIPNGFTNLTLTFLAYLILVKTNKVQAWWKVDVRNIEFHRSTLLGSYISWSLVKTIPEVFPVSVFIRKKVVTYNLLCSLSQSFVMCNGIVLAAKESGNKHFLFIAIFWRTHIIGLY